MTRRQLSSSSSPQVCPPRFGTPRTPGRASLGPHVGRVAAALGKPLMPHQQHVADVALEVDPETGLLVYREVVLVKMRQQGKSELLLPLITHRSMSWPDQRIVYTTNTSGEARRRWEDVHLKRLRASPFSDMFRVRLQIAQETILWTNGSSYSPISTTVKTGGTGDSIDLGMIDEAWVHDDSGVEQSLRPAMLTRPQPQLWICSMVPGPTRAKTIGSAYLRRKMALGRARATAGLTDSTCYFEFGAEEGLEPGDPATWWSCMPALGRTISEAAIRADFDAMELEDFTSEYLSWLPDDGSRGWSVIGEGEWELARDLESVPIDPVALGVDVQPDRSWATICAAGRRADDLRHVEITGREDVPDHQPGTGWVVPRLVEIVREHRPCVVAVNDGAVADEAQEAGLRVHRVSAGDMVSAYGMFYDSVAGPDVVNRRLRHLGQDALNDSVRVGTKRAAGGGWVWDHRTKAVISPVRAATCALWSLATPRVHIPTLTPTSAWVSQAGGSRRRLHEVDEQGNRVIRMGGGGDVSDLGDSA